MNKEKYKPGIGCDVGTANVLISRMTESGNFINKHYRNMLFELTASDEAEDLLSRSDYLCVKTNNKYYIIGDDALKIAIAMGQSDKIVRPMENGILSASLKESSELLFFILKALCGEALVEKESLVFSLPALPINKKIDNRFHQMVLTNFFNKLGYDAKPLGEGVALAYDCNPILKENDIDIPLSGLSFSFGAGMINVALLYKGLEIDSFSITYSGDFIDSNASQVTGIPISNIIKIKETKLDLNNVDASDRVQQALSIYYDELIERTLTLMSNKFKDKKSELDGKLEVVIGGGTSMCPGFINRLEDGFKKIKTPFDILRVRHSKTPFSSVGQGCLLKALSNQSKKNNKN